MTNRITDHPILGKLDESKTISFTFNDKQYKGLKNESIASALLANEIRVLRKHEESGSTRGIYCNIGHCYECRVTVNGEQGIRACLTPLRENMVIASGEKLLTSVKDWRPDNE